MTKYKITTEIDTELKTGIVTGVEEIVVPPPPVKPTVTLSVDKTSIEIGQSITLTWFSTNAAKATLYEGPGDGNQTDIPVNGSLVITPTLVGSQLYTIGVEGPGGFAYDDVTIEVIDVIPPPPPPITGMIIDDFTPRAIPDLTIPAKGATYTDPVFGTDITRITDTIVETGKRMIYAGYCRHDAENADGSKLWVHSLLYPTKHIWNAISPFGKIKDLPVDISTGYDPDFRWHHSDPDILYGGKGSEFRKYRISTGEMIVLHDFKADFPTLIRADGTSAIARVYAKEGANPSLDSRYWAWVVRCYDAGHTPSWWDAALIVYDKDFNGEDNGKIISILNFGDPLFKSGNFINISPKGNWVTVDSEGSLKYFVFPRDLSSRKEIPWNVSVHSFAGLGLDDEGREVAFWVEKYGTLGYWVVMADLENGTKYYLAPFGTLPNHNASGMMFLKPGWAVMSTIQKDSTNWSDGQILIVELTKRITSPTMDNHAHVWRVCHTHSKFASHTDEAFAKPNKKGTVIYFRSNFGTDYTAGGNLDTYRVKLPDGWESIVKGTTPPPPPPPPPIKYICPIDGLEFNTQAELDAHTAAVHTPPPPPGTYIINDLNFYPIPDIPKPDKGVAIEDPVFHSQIVRITDAKTELIGPKLSSAFGGYVKHDIENVDGTKLIIQSYSGSTWHVWNANPPYGKDHDIVYKPGDTGATLDCRWDRTDPNILYYTYKTGFYRWDIITRSFTLIRDFKLDFPETPMVNISLEEEGVQDLANRYWAFIVKCYDAAHIPTWYQEAHLVYDQVENRIISMIRRTDSNPISANFLCISPSGKYVLKGAPPSNIYLASDYSFIRTIPTHGHVTWAIDKTGKEVLVSNGHYYGPTGMTDLGYWITMDDVETGERFWLCPWDAALFHANGSGKPGWAVISSYSPFAPNLPYWFTDASVIMVELTRGNPKPTRSTFTARMWRLAHTHMLRKSYGDDPFAKANSKGTKVWFGSGWGQSVVDGATYDVYQINLPQGWFEELK